MKDPLPSWSASSALELARFGNRIVEPRPGDRPDARLLHGQAMIERLYPTDRDAWLALRRDFIGASDRCLFDVHPYLTRYALWAEKSGLIDADRPRDLADAARALYRADRAAGPGRRTPEAWRIEPNLIGSRRRLSRRPRQPHRLHAGPIRRRSRARTRRHSGQERRELAFLPAAMARRRRRADVPALDRPAGDHGGRLERCAMGGGAPDLRRRLRRARLRHRPVDRRHGAQSSVRRNRSGASSRPGRRRRSITIATSRSSSACIPATRSRSSGSISIPISSPPATTSLPASVRSACSRRASNAPRP